jgi:hypothetical protein
LYWYGSIRRKDGNGVYYDLLGLRMYFDTAEVKRIAFHNILRKILVFLKASSICNEFGLERSG